MIGLTQQIKDVIIDASNDPDYYSQKGERKKLQAAVDMMLDAFSHHLFGRPMKDWMNFRRQLNLKKKEQSLTQKEAKIIEVLLELLRSRDFLHSKDYSDQSDDIRIFCGNHLAHVKEFF